MSEANRLLEPNALIEVGAFAVKDFADGEVVNPGWSLYTTTSRCDGLRNHAVSEGGSLSINVTVICFFSEFSDPFSSFRRQPASS